MAYHIQWFKTMKKIICSNILNENRFLATKNRLWSILSKSFFVLKMFILFWHQGLRFMQKGCQLEPRVFLLCSYFVILFRKWNWSLFLESNLLCNLQNDNQAKILLRSFCIFGNILKSFLFRPNFSRLQFFIVFQVRAISF